MKLFGLIGKPLSHSFSRQFFTDKFLKEGHTFSGDEINLLIIGNVVGFIVAIIAIKTFINILTKHGFKAFGWYRIIVGLAILALLLSGHELSII